MGHTETLRELKALQGNHLKGEVTEALHPGCVFIGQHTATNNMLHYINSTLSHTRMHARTHTHTRSYVDPPVMRSRCPSSPLALQLAYVHTSCMSPGNEPPPLGCKGVEQGDHPLPVQRELPLSSVGLRLHAITCTAGRHAPLYIN